MSDMEARISPPYLYSSVIYQLFLRAFTPGGTLNDAAKLLPHLAEIGVDIVYLCPVNTADDDPDTAHWSDRQNRSGLDNPKNPYRIADYFAVDPEYGTDDDLKAFIRVAHQLGLSVILDLVYLHCGPKAVFLQEHPDYVKLDEQGNIAFGPWHFPLLNFDNPELREYLVDNMLHYILNFGVDGFRCDVATSIPLDFWENARLQLEDVRPDIIMLSEGEKPEYQELAFDMSYNFSWSTMINNLFDGKKNAQDLRNLWEAQHEKFPVGNLFIRSNDNHDIANDAYDNRQEKRWNPGAGDAALLINFTIDGIPFVYNGQEIADAHQHSIYGDRLHGHGLCIDWSKLLTTDGNARLEFFKKLTELRHEATTLTEGDTVFVDNTTPEAVVSFLRTPLEDADDCDCEDDDCDCGCGCGCDDEEDDDELAQDSTLQEEDYDEQDDYEDNEEEEDDDCDCDCDHDHEHEHGADSNILVVVNTSDKPIQTQLSLGLERGTLLNVRMVRGADYRPADDHLVVNLLPYGFLVLEF